MFTEKEKKKITDKMWDLMASFNIRYYNWQLSHLEKEIRKIVESVIGKKRTARTRIEMPVLRASCKLCTECSLNKSFTRIIIDEMTQTCTISGCNGLMFITKREIKKGTDGKNVEWIYYTCSKCKHEIFDLKRKKKPKRFEGTRNRTMFDELYENIPSYVRTLETRRQRLVSYIKNAENIEDCVKYYRYLEGLTETIVDLCGVNHSFFKELLARCNDDCIQYKYSWYRFRTLEDFEREFGRDDK